MKEQLKESLAEELSRATEMEIQKILPLLEQPKNRDHGDLAFPCFTIAKLWGTPPPACATRLAAEIKLPVGISEVTTLGPFLNFRFDRNALVESTVVRVHADKIISKPPGVEKEKIIVEYSSPNIAKPFHVGHLRATLIGNCLDRVYRRLGYPTISINHLGDWGTQFGFVWAGCAIWGKPDDPSVEALVELYRKATSLKETQETQKKDGQELPAGETDVNAMARSYFIDLENGVQYAVDFWQWCLDLSLVYLKETYKRLGVKFDHYTGESFYSDKLERVKTELSSAGVLTESQGAWGVDLGEEIGFARILTPDGRSLYLTRDIAAASYRAETFHFTKALYVVGAPQTLHFQQIKGIFKKLNKSFGDGIEHVAFGHVMGMKTRGEGGAIELNHFLDEAYDRSLTAYREQVAKRPDGLDEEVVARGVALGAIVFSNLNRSRLKDVHFSWDSALAFQGDTGPYLLYGLARVNGVIEKARSSGIVEKKSDLKNYLNDESSFNLAMVLADFDAVLARTVEENEPAHLAAFGLDVAKAFSKAYNELKVVGEEAELAGSRLALFTATGKVLREVIELLGMEPLERM